MPTEAFATPYFAARGAHSLPNVRTIPMARKYIEQEFVHPALLVSRLKEWLKRLERLQDLFDNFDMFDGEQGNTIARFFIGEYHPRVVRRYPRSWQDEVHMSLLQQHRFVKEELRKAIERISPSNHKRWTRLGVLDVWNSRPRKTYESAARAVCETHGKSCYVTAKMIRREAQRIRDRLSVHYLDDEGYRPTLPVTLEDITEYDEPPCEAHYDAYVHIVNHPTFAEVPVEDP